MAMRERLWGMLLTVVRVVKTLRRLDHRAALIWYPSLKLVWPPREHMCPAASPSRSLWHRQWIHLFPYTDSFYKPAKYLSTKISPGSNFSNPIIYSRIKLLKILNMRFFSGYAVYARALCAEFWGAVPGAGNAAFKNMRTSYSGRRPRREKGARPPVEGIRAIVEGSADVSRPSSRCMRRFIDAALLARAPLVPVSSQIYANFFNYMLTGL